MNQIKILQLTLAIIKPHIIKQPHALQGIRDIILASDFKIVRSKKSCLTVPDASKFYEEHNGKFFYNRLVSFMTRSVEYLQFNAILKYNLYFLFVSVDRQNFIS